MDLCDRSIHCLYDEDSLITMSAFWERVSDYIRQTIEWVMDAESEMDGTMLDRLLTARLARRPNFRTIKGLQMLLSFGSIVKRNHLFDLEFDDFGLTRQKE